MNFIKKILFVTIVFTLSIVSFGQVSKASDDITGHWHEEALRTMIEKEIMKGYGNGIYAPNGPVTRGQFSVILKRALNLPLPEEGIGFSDVTEETGVMEGVLPAAGAGIITGYPDGTFKPNQKISRQHMAVMVKRALDYLFIEDKSNDFTFKDKHLILPEYYNAISNSVNYGIFTGSQREDGVYFRPLDTATRGDAAAITVRLLDVIEEHSQTTPEPTPELTFDVATVSASNDISIVKKYATYEDAARNLTGNQVIVYGNSILKMSNGLVVTVPTLGSSLTNIYPTSALGSPFTYVTADTELEYVSSNEDYVEVKVAGVPGFIQHKNSLLKPTHTLTGKSYYSVKNGVLSHSIYSNTKGTYATYTIGKAPSFLTEGPKYYSWDGINFKSENGTLVGKSYTYFQFLSTRSTSTYTAQEIDSYVLSMLLNLEKMYPNNETYKNASTKSKLVGIGTHLKKVEAEKKINALFILSLAQHESMYGLSTRALEDNNFFGLRVYDDNPDPNYTFTSIESNIDTFVDQYMNKNYIPPNAQYANGAVFGNKATGANVKYASDPYWGAKAAGHWYRMDQAMGGKELATPKTIGLTNTAGLNVRTEPRVSTDTLAYRYSKGNLPVIITGEVFNMNGYDWYKVKSDDVNYDELYIAKEYIDILPVQ